jgi:glycosyltransferase involved in cell wall biosynthesis
MTRLMNVLLSAYACEPDKGSEPEVGWQWAMGLAKVCAVTVLTRANNRLPIESALQSVPPPHPRCLYYDLPKPFLALKKLGLPASIYYCLWQIGAALFINKHRREFDLVQHLTFNSFLCPGFLWFLSPPVVLGPLGGGMTTAPFHLHLFGKSALHECFRTVGVKMARFNPLLRLSLHFAKHIWVANKDTLASLPTSAQSKASILLETAAPPQIPTFSSHPSAFSFQPSAFGPQQLPPAFPCVAPSELPSARTPASPHPSVVSISAFQSFSFLNAPPLLFVGRLEPRKAPGLAIQVLQRLHRKNLPLSLTVVGQGPLQESLRRQAAAAGLSSHVCFLGSVSKKQVLTIMRTHLALIFTSVRDTSGNVILEAMANCLPVVAFRHQGVVQMLNDEIGYLVHPRGSPYDVEAFTQAIEQIVADPSARRSKIFQALLRAQGELSWPAKWPEVARMYLSLYNS